MTLAKTVHWAGIITKNSRKHRPNLHYPSFTLLRQTYAFIYTTKLSVKPHSRSNTFYSQLNERKNDEKESGYWKKDAKG